ncbi:MAG: VWA domain-containing protein [Sandaracinus sp.]|nr:VWA domain-containing protein [Sandaracinus sp.]
MTRGLEGWRGVGLGLVMLCGCGANDGAYSASGGREGFDSAAPSEMGGGASAVGVGGGSQLTAGVWDDNVNYALFEDYLADGARFFDPDEHAAAHARFDGERPGHDRLDVALVIDATGSMSDELSYLQSELDAIATRVTAAYPDAETRWALVVYRDEGDEYVTRVFDFDGVGSMRANLRAQSAGGGGDYPEASHDALREMTNLAWREETDVARLGFWIADAPHHEQVENQWANAVRTAGDLDVHVYPVASSGVDDRTERSMRSAAQLTGGRYVFLTDDSGIGGAHLEPTVPCYFVTLLDTAMLRVIDAEMTGTRTPPTEEQIVRRSGEPDADGVCVLEGGSALAF